MVDVEVRARLVLGYGLVVRIVISEPSILRQTQVQIRDVLSSMYQGQYGYQ